jgi:hypothetical protein|tara:strand:- start:4793 stop:5095 length:303 start_codon:yes stop_codon:yes gene_type:complete
VWDCQNAKALNVALTAELFGLFRDKGPCLKITHPKSNQKTSCQNTQIQATIPVKIDQKAKSSVSSMNGLHDGIPYNWCLDIPLMRLKMGGIVARMWLSLF